MTKSLTRAPAGRFQIPQLRKDQVLEVPCILREGPGRYQPSVESRLGKGGLAKMTSFYAWKGVWAMKMGDDGGGKNC